MAGEKNMIFNFHAGQGKLRSKPPYSGEKAEELIQVVTKEGL